jgi:hypothetical protein
MPRTVTMPRTLPNVLWLAIPLAATLLLAAPAAVALEKGQPFAARVLQSLSPVHLHGSAYGQADEASCSGPPRSTHFSKRGGSIRVNETAD